MLLGSLIELLKDWDSENLRIKKSKISSFSKITFFWNTFLRKADERSCAANARRVRNHPEHSSIPRSSFPKFLRLIFWKKNIDFDDFWSNLFRDVPSCSAVFRRNIFRFTWPIDSQVSKTLKIIVIHPLCVKCEPKTWLWGMKKHQNEKVKLIVKNWNYRFPQDFWKFDDFPYFRGTRFWFAFHTQWENSDGF